MNIIKNSLGYKLKCTYHGRHGKVALVHFLGQPVDLPACVAKDDGLDNIKICN